MARAIAKGGFDQYQNVRAGAVRAIGETNDCTVVAFAAATGCGYDKAHEILTQLGRKPRHGFNTYKMVDAARALGFNVEVVPMQEMIRQYPSPHNTLQSVTSHHPDRFHKVWADGHNYWLRSNGHVLAIVNGVTIDWSRGKALRGKSLYRLTKRADARPVQSIAF
jgi:hypothetical protein